MKPAPSRTSAPALADFPGGHAGASLKPGDRDEGESHEDEDFPGGHAGASLKRLVRAGPEGRGRRFPRRTRRGLIEASLLLRL